MFNDAVSINEKNEKFRKNMLNLIQNDLEIQMAIRTLFFIEQNNERQSPGLNQFDIKQFEEKIQALEMENAELKENHKNMKQKNEEILTDNQKQFQENKVIIQKLKTELANCQEENFVLTKNNTELEREKNILEAKVFELSKQVEKEKASKEEAEYISRKYKKDYEKLDMIYKKYLALDSDIHIRLKRVLNPEETPADSAEIFLAYGVQEGNITALWDIIAANADEYVHKNKLADMVGIFTYFFECYKNITYKQVEINIPVIGSDYDERVHTRTACSNATGTITKVILPGFSIGKNISRKSLVCVE